MGSSSPLADEEKLAGLIADRIEPRLVPDIAMANLDDSIDYPAGPYINAPGHSS